MTAAVALLLALHFAMAVASKLPREHDRRTRSSTSPAGLSYWKFDDYRLHPENGNLPQRWVALPAWLGGFEVSRRWTSVYWRTSDAWVMGHEFFYETGQDHFPRLMAARAMTALLSAAPRRSSSSAGRAGSSARRGRSCRWPSSRSARPSSPHGGSRPPTCAWRFFMLASLGAWWRHLRTPRARTVRSRAGRLRPGAASPSSRPSSCRR